MRRTVARGFLQHARRSVDAPCECARIWIERMTLLAAGPRLNRWKNSGGTYCPHGVLLVPAGEQPREIEAERVRRASHATARAEGEVPR